ncbi:MAG: hypothetical protein AAGI89_12870 [Pseudomonadota bacterium]
MQPRKRTIAGFVVIAMVVSGVFAYAILADDGPRRFADAWDRVQVWNSQPAGEPQRKPDAKPRVAHDWSGVDDAPMHPIGDANSRRSVARQVPEQALDQLSAESRAPIDFDAWTSENEEEPSDAPMGIEGPLAVPIGLPGGLAASGAPWSPGVQVFGEADLAAVAIPASTLHPIAFSSIGGIAGGGMIADPSVLFTGTFSSAEAVATPLPHGFVLFGTVFVTWLGHQFRSNRQYTLG